MAMLDAYVTAGGNFIDTADVYGSSEDLIGKWLSSKGPAFRRSLVIATKFGVPTGPHPNDKGASRKHIMDAVDSSLRRLQTPWIDLYQQHWWDATTPLSETLNALDDLVRSGKVRYVGMSNWVGHQVVEAAHLCKEQRLTPFVTIQQQYSLLCRTLEWDLLDVLQRHSIGVLPWSPLAGGWLSGRYSRASTKEEQGSRVEWAEQAGWAATSFSQHNNEGVHRVLDELEKAAREVEQPIAAVALRWLLQKEQVSSVLIGARSVKQLQDNLLASSFTLSDGQVQRLDDVSQQPLPYPVNLQKGATTAIRRTA